MKKNERILVTGSNGLLGSSIIQELKSQNYKYIYKLNREKCDLEDRNLTKKIITDFKPHYIFHCANKVYGIRGNFRNKFKMINTNNIINSNILNAVESIKLKKFIAIGSSAGYPNLNKKLKETDFLNGEPHSSEFFYGISKRDLFYQLLALKESNKLNFNYVILNNLYGIGDNFDTENGHVVPALIHKCYLSIKNNKKFEVLGRVDDKRSFLNSKDAAKAIIIIAKKYKGNLINLGSKTEISIKKLVLLIMKISKNKNKIEWKKIDNQAVKKRRLDLSEINKLKINEKYTLEKGLMETYNWFKKTKVD